MQRSTTLHLVLLALLTLAISFGASSCTEDSPTNPNGNDTTDTNQQIIGDTARGRYLVENVAGCGGCHTPTDPVTHAPIISKMFAGGELFDLGPFVGKVYTANITPDSATGIGGMTDAQLTDAITKGIVTHTHGSQTHTDTLIVMPYQHYAYLTDYDVKAIIAYLRHVVKPVTNEVQEKAILLPFTPYFGKLGGFPDSTNATTGRGRYLTIIGSCNDCHTPRNPDFSFNMSKFLQGGEVFPMGPADSSISGNLTPHATGLAEWTDAQINAALSEGKERDGTPGICPPMPWQVYKGMTQVDRDAIIAYLRIVPAVNNPVEDPCNHN
jgi:mono/diheme cytochrome c family protein